jgi:hypothetical protein
VHKLVRSKTNNKQMAYFISSWSLLRFAVARCRGAVLLSIST